MLNSFVSSNQAQMYEFSATLANIVEGITGHEFGRDGVLFIQDVGTKVTGVLYIDKSSSKIYKALEDTADMEVSEEKFEELVLPIIGTGGSGEGVPGPQGEKGEKGDPGEKGEKGEKGDPGQAFTISKVFTSVNEMNEGFASDGIAEGAFVIINTTDVNDPDNSKLYYKGTTQYEFLTDLSGATGIQGPKGDTGAQGEKGDQGEKGEKGDTGAQGPAGADGAPGEKGEKGDPGEKGDTGEQGPAGAPGEKGEKGDPGQDGAQGPQGLPGADGAKGDKGDPGEKGEKGDPGEQGPAGTPGEKGEKGDPGEKGDTGEQGPAGADGASAEIVSVTATANVVNGNPTVSVQEGGTNIAKTLAFTFGIPNPIKYVEGTSDEDGYIKTEIAPQNDNTLILARMYLHPNLNMWCPCVSYQAISGDENVIITGGIKGSAVLVGGSLTCQTFANCKYRVYYVEITPEEHM